MRKNAMKRIICAMLTAIILLSSIAALPISSASDDGTNAELEAQGYIGISTEEELKTTTQDFYLKNDIFFTSGIGISRDSIRIHGNGHTVYFAGGISIMESGKRVNVEDLNLAGNVIITEGSFGENNPVHYGPVVIKQDTSSTSNFYFRNVNSNVNITVIDDKFNGSIGGIAGYANVYSTFLNCSYIGTISTVGGSLIGVNVGGLIGYGGGYLYIGESYAKAKIIVNSYKTDGVGGLVGKTVVSQIIQLLNCVFDGSITVRGETRDYGGVGGIVGVLEHTEKITFNFSDLTNYGNIMLENSKSTVPVGGIIGRIYNSDLTINLDKLINNGSIIGNSVAGGIIGSVESSDSGKNKVVIKTIKNSGAVSAVDTAGGIIGYIGSNNQVMINSALNEGSVSVSGENATGAAGIIGTIEEPMKQNGQLTSGYNVGEISGANATPLLHAEGYSENNTERNYYTNEVEGEHIGEKITSEEMAALIEKINFPTINTDRIVNLLSEISTLESGNYTTESWANLQKAASEAEKAIENPTRQWVIDEAARNLEVAKTLLKIVELPADELEKINALMSECQKLWASDYTTASWQRLQNAMSLMRAATTATDKRSAYNELLSAKEQLVYVRDLKNALKKLPQNESSYPDKASWLLAYAAIQNADSILALANVAQADVDAATEAILELIKKFGFEETTGPYDTDVIGTGTGTGIGDETDDPYMSDFEKLKDAWLDYLTERGMTPPEGDSTGISPDDSIALQDAWRAFLAMQLANTGVGHIGGTQGTTDNGLPNLGGTLAIAAIAVIIVIAIIALIAARRRED